MNWIDVVAPPDDHTGADGSRYSGVALSGAQMFFLLGEAPKMPWSEGTWMTLTRPA